jgi:hypothetical protein
MVVARPTRHREHRNAPPASDRKDGEQDHDEISFHSEHRSAAMSIILTAIHARIYSPGVRWS